MLSGAYPIPANNGAKRRILASASCFSQRHEVTLVSLQAQEPGRQLIEENNHLWKDYVVDFPLQSRSRVALKSCLSRCSYGQVKYWNDEYKTLVVTLLNANHYDALWLHTLNMAPYIQQYFTTNGEQPKRSRPFIILDQQNVDELYFKSFVRCKTNLIWRIFATMEMVKARRVQKLWFPRFDMILCVAPEDLHATARYINSRTNLCLAPNAVDIDYFYPKAVSGSWSTSPMLVFGGSLDVAMNQDAVSWFVSDVLPTIEQQIEDVHFMIVGKDPPPEIRDLAKQQGIIVTGTVPDVRDYYQQADVFVVPLRTGGGTKVKTLEAMAMGLPVVSTSVGAQGLEVESGRHLIIADNARDFSTSVIELVKECQKAKSIGVEARRFVEQRYSWAIVMDLVDHEIMRYYDKFAKI